jgi:hypothetical protein
MWSSLMCKILLLFNLHYFYCFNDFLSTFLKYYYQLNLRGLLNDKGAEEVCCRVFGGILLFELLCFIQDNFILYLFWVDISVSK